MELRLVSASPLAAPAPLPTWRWHRPPPRSRLRRRVRAARSCERHSTLACLCAQDSTLAMHFKRAAPAMAAQ
eukprot:3031408-Pleurochrysis_carterae.AAC.1